MRFVDEVRIRLEAGKGGQGCVSFRREKYVPRGGPDGGDGGKGGDIYLAASERKQTLIDFHYRHYFRAPSGKHGQGQNKHGRSGEDIILEVPVGTVVKEMDTGEIIADLTKPGEQWLAAQGGMGGKGNARFVTSAMRVPRFAEDGHEGEQKELVLELKLLADVGLVGLPNAGKSTLIASISAARPKIADYPFTTLVPNLGVVQYADSPSFVVADIPGLIEGAHLGVGLGTRFLRHIERTRILLHVIDVSQVPMDNPLRPFEQIEKELDRYSSEISQKRRVVALNKIDLIKDPERLEELAATYRQTNYPVVKISALQRVGLRDLLKLLLRFLTPQNNSGSYV